MSKKTTIELISALLALLFIYAAISKLLDFQTFRFQINRALYIGHFASFIAIALPIGELLLVCLLLYKKTRLIGIWASFIIMLVFSVYVAMMLLSGRHLPCTCGGVIQKMSWGQHLVFNILFTLLALTGIIIYKSSDAVDDNNSYSSISLDPGKI